MPTFRTPSLPSGLRYSPPALLFVALLLLALAACGDDDDGEQTSVCDQAANVQQSVVDLSNINPVSDGSDALRAGVDDVKSEVEGLRDAVEEEIRDEVDAFITSLTQAEETFANLGDAGSINAAIDEIQVAVTGVVASAGALRDALSQECG
jgi:hypothetical protein